MNRILAIAVAGLLLSGFCACGHVSHGGWQPASGNLHGALPNWISVPMCSRELIMDEVADEVDDYFRILREQRIRLQDNILTEGWIDTEPRIGSTILEPWRKDSSPGFERQHATFQCVRRWARVRVIPNGTQYLIDVKVYKELEDLEAPEKSTVSGEWFRHDNSLDFNRYGDDELLDSPPNKGWIPMGRDCALEQTILKNIQSRLTKLNSAGL